MIGLVISLVIISSLLLLASSALVYFYTKFYVKLEDFKTIITKLDLLSDKLKTPPTWGLVEAEENPAVKEFMKNFGKVESLVDEDLVPLEESAVWNDKEAMSKLFVSPTEEPKVKHGKKR